MITRGLLKHLKRPMTCFLLLPLFAVQAFALHISGTPPTAADPSEQSNLDTAFNGALAALNNKVSKISHRPTKMTKAFADSAAFSNHTATQRGYMEYDLFAFTVGSMVGFAVPGVSGRDIANLADDLKNKGDARFGANLQVWACELGINSSFILDGLYLGLKFGFSHIDIPTRDNIMKYDYWSLGLLGRYQIVKPVSVSLLASWKGIAVGTGFIYQHVKTDYSMYVGDFEHNVGGINVTIDTQLDFLMQYSDLTMPVEIMTGVNLLKVLTLHAGLGFDINAISGELAIHSRNDIESSVAITKKGNIILSEKMGIKPGWFHPKLMTGIGFEIGPVVVDVPFTYYIGSGFNFGVSLGFIW